MEYSKFLSDEARLQFPAESDEPLTIIMMAGVVLLMNS